MNTKLTKFFDGLKLDRFTLCSLLAGLVPILQAIAIKQPITATTLLAALTAAGIGGAALGTNGRDHTPTTPPSEG